MRAYMAAAAMLATAGGASAQPAPPAPLAQVAVLVPGPGVSDASMAYSRAAVAARDANHGLQPSKVEPALFDGCFADAAGAEACVRERLKPARLAAREVAVAVIVTTTDEGGTAWTCLGGSRQNEFADWSQQHLILGGKSAPDDARVQEIVDGCLGQAGNEYNVP